MITKCLFPVAGYGTRFLPATKAVPKEMLPILTKPLIQYGVEEAMEAGCTTMAMVTSKHKKPIEDHFDTHSDIENSIRGSAKERLMDGLNAIIDECEFTFIRQKSMKGLGHAILTGEPLIGNEPFAVILPDDLCTTQGYEFGVQSSGFGDSGFRVPSSEKSTPNPEPRTQNPELSTKGVLSQMVALYERYPDHSIVAIEEVPEDQTDRYGVIEGVEMEEGVFRVTDMIEKPDPSEAPTNLAIIGRYILTPDIFDIIRETKPGKGGEIQITDALLQQAKQGRVLAYKFKGRRFDCGQVEGFVSATNFFFEKLSGRG